jgi:DNA-binding CsgD family transcriptional regulator
MGQNGNGGMQAPLSAEEARLASLLAQGRASDEIARAFGIEERELHARLSVLETKLGNGLARQTI